MHMLITAKVYEHNTHYNITTHARPEPILVCFFVSLQLHHGTMVCQSPILWPAISKPKKASAHASSTTSSSTLTGLRQSLLCFVGGEHNFGCSNSLCRFFCFLVCTCICRFCFSSSTNCFFTWSGAFGHTFEIIALRSVGSPERCIRAFLFGRTFPPNWNSQ